MPLLRWPAERAAVRSELPEWSQSGSNLVLDFHGDPARAALVVFSDGNHHMALGQCLEQFACAHSELGEIFYATTPPAVLLGALANGGVRVGNLVIAARPHVFIGPGAVLDRVCESGAMAEHRAFARSRGNVLLVPRGNPKSIRGIEDLARPDVRLFLSHPEREAASHRVYRETLEQMAAAAGVTLDLLGEERSGTVVHGECIHHREAPQAVADGRADAAIVYFHLALRYTRVFPDRFEIVALDGAPEQPAAHNVLTTLHIGVLGDGGRYGRSLLEFMTGSEAAAVYEHHGLARVGE